MIDLQLQRRVACRGAVEVRKAEGEDRGLACLLSLLHKHKGALELEPHIHVRMRRGLWGPGGSDM